MRKMGRIQLTFFALILCFLMLGCQTGQEDGKSVKPSGAASLTKTDNLDFRLNFNKIKVSKDKKQFRGGSNLEQLKMLFGQPDKKEETSAGEVMLDSYTWTRDGAIITVQLYQDSTVARSITNFSFNREAKIGKSDYKRLKLGMTYQQVLEQLGEADVLSQSISSDKEEQEAVWSSGIKTQASSASIDLYFEDGLLKNKLEHNLE